MKNSFSNDFWGSKGILDYPLVTKQANNDYTGTIKYFRNANLKLSIVQLVLGIRKNPIFNYL